MVGCVGFPWVAVGDPKGVCIDLCKYFYIPFGVLWVSFGVARGPVGRRGSTIFLAFLFPDFRCPLGIPVFRFSCAAFCQVFKSCLAYSWKLFGAVSYGDWMGSVARTKFSTSVHGGADQVFGHTLACRWWHRFSNFQWFETRFSPMTS